jgi:hypothetical protein
MQARWGCPRAKCSPVAALDVDLREASDDHAKLAQITPSGTCPYAASLSPWGRQIVSAHRLCSRLKGGLTVAQSLGREPHRWDVLALDAALCAMDDVSESDDAARERERKAREAAQPQHGPTWTHR